MKISVVVPVYGCPPAVKPLVDRLSDTIEQITTEYEIILVNDACPYGSWGEIVAASKCNNHVIGINLARNFGQARAILAGLDKSDGDWIVVMDCDLQDRPEGILDLYKKAQEGYDVVFARRKDRKDTALVKFLSRSFYHVYNYFTDGNYDGSINNFSIASRQVINQFCFMREQTRAYTLFIKWLGFRQTEIDIDADARYEGKSAYNFKKKMDLACNLITSQSNKPLVMSIRLGMCCAFGSFLFVFYQIARYFKLGNIPIGWTSVIASIYLMGGLILIALGILGIYIGNIFSETKHRPIYVIKDVIQAQNIKENQGKFD